MLEEGFYNIGVGTGSVRDNTVSSLKVVTARGREPGFASQFTLTELVDLITPNLDS